jgi:hypothetical protein
MLSFDVLREVREERERGERVREKGMRASEREKRGFSRNDI